MNRPETASGDPSDAYNLRLSSLVKRVQVERRQATPKQPKGKSKPPPLSKYRRRTANARERMRMKDINEGFERLRQSLPEMEEQSRGKKEKLTKFTILSLALNYIHALRDILGYPSEDGSRSSRSSGMTPSGSEESDLGSDAASTRTTSVSSASCDEICSNPSPSSSATDLKEYSMADPAPSVSPVMPRDLARSRDPLPGSSSTMMEFREAARSSPASSVSNPSLSPSPPPLPLPEECMDIDQSDLLDVSISIAALDGIEDIVM